MKFIRIIFGFLISFALFNSFVFATVLDDNTEAQTEVYEEKTITFEEIIENVKKYESENVNLDAFLEKEYNGCYGNQLDEESRYIYDSLVSNIETTKDGVSDIGDETISGQKGKWINIKSSTYSEFINDLEFMPIYYGIMAFNYDYPDVFWMNYNKISISAVTTKRLPNGDKDIWVKIIVRDGYENYFSDGYNSKEDVEADILKINQEVSNIKTAVKNFDTYNKIKYINNYLVDKNEYNRFLGEIEFDTRVYSCVSALIYGSSSHENTLNPVCEGYSRAFKVICDALNIETALSQGDFHMWNYVKMPDQNWYGIDVTWNDPIFASTPSQALIEKCKMKYFLLGADSFFNGNETATSKHTQESTGVFYTFIEGLAYPVLTDTDYVYIPNAEEITETSTEVSTEETTEISTDASTEETTESSTETSTEASTETSTEVSTEETTNESDKFISGDVNGNGIVDVDDASLLLQRILKGGFSEYEKKAGKVDKSKSIITANDVSYILQKALGNI